MLAIWSLVPLPFLNPGGTSGSLQFTYCWSLAWRILSITFLACEIECNCVVVWAFFGIAFLWDWNENWPFPVLWPLRSFPYLLANIECSTFRASSFRIWNSSTGIPSPPLVLFVVILPKAYLTSHSRMSGSRWVITPLWYWTYLVAQMVKRLPTTWETQVQSLAWKHPLEKEMATHSKHCDITIHLLVLLGHLLVQVTEWNLSPSYLASPSPFCWLPVDTVSCEGFFCWASDAWGSRACGWSIRTSEDLIEEPEYTGMLSHFSCVGFLATLWTVAHQAPLSMGYPRQEYWSGLPCLPPGNLPDPGIEPTSLMSPASAGGVFTTSATWEAHMICGTKEAVIC